MRSASICREKRLWMELLLYRRAFGRSGGVTFITTASKTDHAPACSRQNVFTQDEEERTAKSWERSNPTRLLFVNVSPYKIDSKNNVPNGNCKGCDETWECQILRCLLSVVAR